MNKRRKYQGWSDLGIIIICHCAKLLDENDEQIFVPKDSSSTSLECTCIVITIWIIFALFSESTRPTFSCKIKIVQIRHCHFAFLKLAKSESFFFNLFPWEFSFPLIQLNRIKLSWLIKYCKVTIQVQCDKKMNSYWISFIHFCQTIHW